MFKFSDIDGLPAPDAADVLREWHSRLPSVMAHASPGHVGTGGGAKTDVLLLGWRAQVVESLDQMFVTTIPAMRAQQFGCDKKRDALLDKLRKLQILI